MEERPDRGGDRTGSNSVQRATKTRTTVGTGLKMLDSGRIAEPERRMTVETTTKLLPNHHGDDARMKELGHSNRRESLRGKRGEGRGKQETQQKKKKKTRKKEKKRTGGWNQAERQKEERERRRRKNKEEREERMRKKKAGEKERKK